MIPKLAKGFMMLLLIIPIVRAQSAPPQASAPEKKSNRSEREKRTLALVDEIIDEAQSLRLPENRIRIGMALAGSLWSRDEKRARSLWNGAADGLRELKAAIDGGDPEYLNQTQLPQQLRQEIAQIAASHDPKLAVEFLRATRVDSPSRPPNSGLTNLEANLEMRVAAQIAAKDPSEALSLAEDSLKITLDYEALSLLYNLQSQQKAVAERFLEDILDGIRTYGIGNSSATPVALSLLNTWIENNRAAKDPSAPRTTPNLSLSNFDEGTARELSNMIIDALLSNAPARTVSAYDRKLEFDGRSALYPGQIFGMLQQLKPMLPDIERLAPGRMAALRARIVELEKSYAAQQGPWAAYQELTNAGSPEALIEAAKTAPSEVADNLIQQAAWKAINQGDDERASQIIETLADPAQRAYLKAQVARQALYRAREQKKTAEARALLARLPLDEQVSFLVQLAGSSVAEGDKPGAFQLLAEAQGLLAGRALNYGQLQAQMQIARAYEELDATKGAQIVERVIDQVNELAAAALVLNGFDVQGYFRNGEFIITGGNPLNMVANECGRALGNGALNDVDRARLTAERFQRPEMRLIALLEIAQAALASDGRSTE